MRRPGLKVSSLERAVYCMLDYSFRDAALLVDVVLRMRGSLCAGYLGSIKQIEQRQSDQ